MKLTYLVSFFFVLTIISCDLPTELPILEKAKKADIFAKSFITNITRGKVNDAINSVDNTTQYEAIKDLIITASNSLRGAKFRTYRVVESSWRSYSFSNKDDYTIYSLGYEYKYQQANVLFVFKIKEMNNVLSVANFNGKILSAPLEDLTKFDFNNKTYLHYVFILLSIIILVINIWTFIYMTYTKISIKKKILWGVLILSLSFPKILINWNSGEIDFNIFNFSLLGGVGLQKANLYSSWILSFNIPIGALLYWNKKKNIINIKIVD